MCNDLIKRWRWKVVLLLAALCFLGVASFGCANVVQSDACKAYVSCLAARDASLGISTDVKRFAVGGGCWGSPEGATLCTNACTNGMAWLKKAYDNLPAACQ